MSQHIDQHDVLRLSNYSPYNFIREYRPELLTHILLPNNGQNFTNHTNNHIYKHMPSGIQFYYSLLAWDSDYFNIPTVQLKYVLLHGCRNMEQLQQAITYFLQNLQNTYEDVYLFTELPPEDTFVIQALNLCGLKLIESRLHYYKKKPFIKHEILSCKVASANDAQEVARVSTEVVNPYDRYHADKMVSTETANKYLGTYAAAAVNGFCTEVLIPAHETTDSFMALNHKPVEELNMNYSRIVLTAVGPNNKGWHFNYMKATENRAIENNSDYLLMTTQITNRAVIKNAEKLNMHLGYTSFILSFATKQF